MSARVEEGTTSHIFPDLEMGVLYTVEVTCEVAGVSLACGEVTVATRDPDLVTRCPAPPPSLQRPGLPPAAGGEELGIGQGGVPRRRRPPH